MRILIINAGSSSLKCACFQLTSKPGDDPVEPIWSQELSFGLPQAAASSVSEAVEQAINGMRNAVGSDPDVVGHRVVHGADVYSSPTLIDDAVVDDIQKLVQFAPLHNRLNLEGIVSARALLPAARHIAVFDTTFHRTMPPSVMHYPLPFEWAQERKIMRYGFHGISHQYATTRVAAMLKKPVSALNLIVCHLGSGCSLTAVEAGRSVYNSMGFTPLEGVMMGTRSGSIDPGILLYLMRSGITEEEIDRLLNKESGLLGVSGVSNDLRAVLAAADEGNRQAKLAVDMFVLRIQHTIGALLVQLQRLDALVFTAGIGENSAVIRAKVSECLRFIGCALDEGTNSSARQDIMISSQDSALPVLVIKAREDWQIACECWAMTV